MTNGFQGGLMSGSSEGQGGGGGGSMQDPNVCHQPQSLDPGEEARRGLKRAREELTHCDCDDVYIPLSKKINGLNIQMQQVQQQQQIQPPRPSFSESYPYPMQSTYYESNHLLYHLHLERMERMQRHQQLQQGPRR